MSKRKAPRSQHGWVSQEAWDAALASKGVVLVTVHGTGDGDTTDAGTRWWQIGSDFIERVGREQPLSDTTITALPFHWSGANSDFDRYQSSKVLNRALSYLRSQSIRHHVLAHSHGGNVVQNAFQYHGAKNVARSPISTYGAPFFQRRRNFVNRIAIFGNFISFIVSILALAGSFYQLFIQDSLETSNYRRLIENISRAPFDIIGSLIIIPITWRFAILPLLNKYTFLREQGKIRITYISSKHDEVLRLLPQLLKISPPDLVTRAGTRRKIIQNITSIGIVLAVAYELFWIFYSYIVNPIMRGEPIFDIGTSLSGFLLGGYITYVEFLIISIIMAFSTSAIVANFINYGAFNTLRNSALGEDHDYNLVDIKRTSSSMKEFGSAIVTEILLEKIDLGGITEDQRYEVTRTFYSNVIMNESNSIHSELFTVWQTLNHGLYHNAYFRDDEVIALTAKIIAEHLSKAPAR